MRRHLLAAEAQVDLDRSEVGGSDVDLGVLHIAARQPQNAVGKLLRPFVVMQVSGDAGGVLRRRCGRFVWPTSDVRGGRVSGDRRRSLGDMASGSACGVKLTGHGVCAWRACVSEQGKQVAAVALLFPPPEPEQLEHSSVSGSLTALQEQGYEIDLVDIKQDGTVDLAHLRELAAAGHHSGGRRRRGQRTGRKQPVAEIAALLKDYPHCHLHVDATCCGQTAAL